MVFAWDAELTRLGIAQGPELASQRRVLGAGGGDSYSDIDLVVEALPGRWGGLWSRRADLFEPVGVAPDLCLEHQWGPVKDVVCYGRLGCEGVYLDLDIWRAGGARHQGETALWRAEAPGAAGEPEAAPRIELDRMDDCLALFWIEALLCARRIARGTLLAALDLLGSTRNRFLLAWRLAHDSGRATHGWTSRVDEELPVAVRVRLAATVPPLRRPELAAALLEMTALMDDHGPGLAVAFGRTYPGEGAALVSKLVGEAFIANGLPAEAPTRFAPPVGRQAVVSLREVTQSTCRAVCMLDVAPDQRHVVAPNARSLAQAHFAGERAWYRAVYADETLVGFIMLYDDPEKADYFLWRFMIDARYQGLGYGRQAIGLLVEHVRTRPGAKELRVSYHKGPGGPADFYRRLGFVETGEVDDGEHVARLALGG